MKILIDYYLPAVGFITTARMLEFVLTHLKTK
jgi:hypothetical protein